MSREDKMPCSLPVFAEPASLYREYAPPPALEPYLVCAWTMEIGGGNRSHEQRVLPDGCSDIVWFGNARPIVVGAMTRPVLANAETGTTLVGLRFRPAVAARVLGAPAHELTDRDVPLDALWHGDVIDQSSERMFEARTAAGRVAIAQSLVTSCRDAIRRPDPVVQRAVSLLSTARCERIKRVARHIGVSERLLHRRFVAAVGYSPKTFQRIIRFQRLLALARANHQTPLGHVALCAGYTDQAHMTREVGEFAGVTPSALLGKVGSALAIADQRGR